MRCPQRGDLFRGLLTAVDPAEESSRWHASADDYDAWFDRPWGRHATAIEHDVLLQATGPVAGHQVIDAGCGTGRFTRRLEADGATVIAIDRDRAALDLTGRRTRAPRLVADVHVLPIATASVDLACAVTVCEFAAEPGAVIAELVRVTRPGGRVVIGSINPHSPWGRWNREQLNQPSWSNARFLDRDSLTGIGRRHGRVELHRGLYSPTSAAPPTLVGTRPRSRRPRAGAKLGAFQTLTIHLPSLPATATSALGRPEP